MNALYSLVLVLALIAVAVVGAGAAGWHFLFGVLIPYVAVALFVIGVVYKVVDWARSPVPFRITTTCGQQESLPWIKQNKLDNPSTNAGTIGRMLLEVLFFRSLFRNTKLQLVQEKGPKLTYGSSKWLWLFALIFHWSFLIIVLRHMRFFTEPVPGVFMGLETLDGLLQIGAPTLYMTDLLIVVGLTYLFLRRVVVPQIRYISLPADYFPLFLLLGIVLSGIFLRYFAKTDIIGVKELTMGLATFTPVVPDTIGVTFYVHLFLVSILLVYFPLSKLMHMGGVFMSPTRNLPNNNRMQRHINPWNYPVKVHTYAEYEDEFRDVMKEAGIPVEKE
ncbi:MAG: sulfate reduction electron transfer complex DsrMKJOP subunit DsrM [Thermodesulfobacteriota bacterium]